MEGRKMTTTWIIAIIAIYCFICSVFIWTVFFIIKGVIKLNEQIEKDKKVIADLDATIRARDLTIKSYQLRNEKLFPTL